MYIGAGVAVFTSLFAFVLLPAMASGWDIQACGNVHAVVKLSSLIGMAACGLCAFSAMTALFGCGRVATGGCMSLCCLAGIVSLSMAGAVLAGYRVNVQPGSPCTPMDVTTLHHRALSTLLVVSIATVAVPLLTVVGRLLYVVCRRSMAPVPQRPLLDPTRDPFGSSSVIVHTFRSAPMYVGVDNPYV